MDDEQSHLLSTTLNLPSNEARERLHSIMTSDMAEAIEQINLTLEACNTKKMRLLNRLDDVAIAVDAVRTECNCIDTTIASKILHLNKLATQIVQQMALVNIPDPPPPPEPITLPPVEIDLSSVRQQLSGLDHKVKGLDQLLREKEETVLYVINKRPGSGDITTAAHSPVRLRGKNHDYVDHQMSKLQTLVRNMQVEEHHHHYRSHLRQPPTRQVTHELSPLDDEENSSQTNGQVNGHRTQDDEEDEISHDSDQTTVGPYTLYLQEKTEDLNTKQSNVRHSMTNSNYTDRSHSLTAASADSDTNYRRRLGEALASNGTDIIYYDYERKLICVTGTNEYTIEFRHGFVVDLYWWETNNEWLILSEQGLYRWKAGDSEYHEGYEFSNGEIGFRRIAVSATSIFCLFRYSLMILELTNSMQMKRLHALAPPNGQYRQLADISVRNVSQPDGSEEEILGLIWFGSHSGILLEERLVTSHANNVHQRLFRHVNVRKGRYARLAPYDDGRAWLISNTGADVFWIVHYTNPVDGQFEVMATWVKVNSGIPINAVSSKDSAICIRLRNGKLEFLASEQ
ncbi:unnamed protein product [Adineta ricciae]|uniref:Uncharacterized protein n=1 Tax=Adineta ricciae TaxID=249248 RepID=A0A814I643_ADIRI|nr:unnamed protein product [Adineta ricciae]